jgi:hypothetical protein
MGGRIEPRQEVDRRRRPVGGNSRVEIFGSFLLSGKQLFQSVELLVEFLKPGRHCMSWSTTPKKISSN